MRETPETFRDDTELESMIRAAGRLVQPSSNLRPRILESAREHRSDQRTKRKLGTVAFLGLSLMGLVMAYAPDLDAIHWQKIAPTTAQIQREAAALETLPRVGREWGLTEAFTRLRRDQASWFGSGTISKQ